MQKLKCSDKNTSLSLYKNEIIRTKKVLGQLEAVLLMMKNEKYCINILQQLKASRSALHSLEASILKSHLNTCVKGLFGKKNKNLENKLDELLNLFSKCDCSVDCMSCSCFNCKCCKECKSEAKCTCENNCKCCKDCISHKKNQNS